MLTIHLTSQQPQQLDISVETTIPLSAGIVGLIGPSGCGKSSLLKAIAGINPLLKGNIQLNERCLQSDDIYLSTQQRQVGLVFQDLRLFPHLNALQNLEYALKRSAQQTITLQQVITGMGIEALVNKEIHELSGGEQQRIAIARACLYQPQLLLLDEPFTGLDQEVKQQILVFLANYHKQYQCPIIMVTHDLAEIRQLTKYLIVMEKGRITQEGETLVLVNQPDLQQSKTQFISTIECQYHPQQPNISLCQLQLDDQALWVAKLNHCDPNSVIRCMINAQDISLCTQPPVGCSIANCLAVTIVHIHHHQMYCVLHLRLQSQILYAEITQHSLTKLQFSVGQQCFALIKAAAIRPSLLPC